MKFEANGVAIISRRKHIVVSSGRVEAERPVYITAKRVYINPYTHFSRTNGLRTSARYPGYSDRVERYRFTGSETWVDCVRPKL